MVNRRHHAASNAASRGCILGPVCPVPTPTPHLPPRSGMRSQRFCSIWQNADHIVSTAENLRTMVTYYRLSAFV